MSPAGGNPQERANRKLDALERIADALEKIARQGAAPQTFATTGAGGSARFVTCTCTYDDQGNLVYSSSGCPVHQPQYTTLP